MYKWVSLAVFISSSIFANAQNCCVTCYGDFSVKDGYYSSNLCNPANKCTYCRPAEQESLESANPGILVEQHAGKMLVRRIIENSLAQHAGVRIGDEIVSINGTVVGRIHPVEVGLLRMGIPM